MVLAQVMFEFGGEQKGGIIILLLVGLLLFVLLGKKR
jgi:hypothetical protein